MVSHMGSGNLQGTLLECTDGTWECADGADSSAIAESDTAPKLQHRVRSLLLPSKLFIKRSMLKHRGAICFFDPTGLAPARLQLLRDWKANGFDSSSIHMTLMHVQRQLSTFEAPLTLGEVLLLRRCFAVHLFPCQ